MLGQDDLAPEESVLSLAPTVAAGDQSMVDRLLAEEQADGML